jgi:hypothetical protein
MKSLHIFWITLIMTLLCAGNATAQIVSMGAFSTCGGEENINLYLNDLDNGVLHTLKENCDKTWQFANLNLEKTKAVFIEWPRTDPVTDAFVRVYDIKSKSMRTLLNTHRQGVAYFDSQGKIVYNADDGYLWRMDDNGENKDILAIPESPYYFSFFSVSPDRSKIVAAEDKWVGGTNYWKDHYFRHVIMDADGTDRMILTEPCLGDWNMISWKPDSDGFLVYYREFSGPDEPVHKEFPKYVAFDFSAGSIQVNDLSNSDLGKEENILLYTQCGTLLSLNYQELYNAKTGSFLSDASSLFPSASSLLGSLDETDICFADLDGSNFKRFECGVITAAIDVKPGSDCNCINPGSFGVVPLVVFTSHSFDATLIDPETVNLAGATLKLVGKGNKLLFHYEDVNSDGLLDFVCQVLTEKLLIEPGSGIVVFKAATYSGQPIRGEDVVCIVPRG